MFSKFRNATLLLLLSAIFLAGGCGDSKDDFVFTGGNTGNTGPGSQLVFRFQRPVTAQTAVAPNTTTIRFDLYSSAPPTSAALLSSETRLYADLIVLENVSSETRSVTVTLFNQSGVPTGSYTKSLSVPDRSRIEVLLENETFTPSNFSALTLTPNPIEFYITCGNPDSDTIRLTADASVNGTLFPVPVENLTLTTAHPNVLKFLDSDLVQALRTFSYFDFGDLSNGHRGNTTLTATYTLNQVTQQATAPVRIHHFGSETGLILLDAKYLEIPIPRGTIDEWASEFGLFLYIGPDSVRVPIDGENVTFALETSSDKISLNPETRVLNIAADTPLGTKFTLINTWVDNRAGGSNHTYVERIPFVVAEQEDR